MKYTNLEYVQSILSSLGADEINSVSDTPESLQVLDVVKTTYFNILSRTKQTRHDQLIQLDPSLDPSMPVLMYVPDGISEIKWLKYFNSNVLDVATGGGHDINVDIVTTENWMTTSTTSNSIGLGTKIFTVASSTLPVTTGQTVTAVSGPNSMTGTVTTYVGTTLTLSITDTVGSGTFTDWVISANGDGSAVPGYEYVTILPFRQFVDMVTGFNPAETDVESFTFLDNSNQFPGNFTFYYKNSKQPQYCTVLSNYYVIFDSYDNTQDSTLQSSKTMAEGTVVPTWSNTDSFIPNLDEEQVPLLLNEAKSLAFFELKQSVHSKAEQESKRQWSAFQRNKSIVNRPTYFDALPDFGRRGMAPTNTFKDRGWDR